MRKTLVAAHTGCGIHPDNTMESFFEGIEIGADIVEVDVRVSKDGTPILLHDDSPYLHTHTFEQLKQPDIRPLLDSTYKTYDIATLEQVLQASESLGMKLNVDVKSMDSIDQAVLCIRRFNAQKRVFITGCSNGITEKYPDIQVMMNTPYELSPQQEQQYEAFMESVCHRAQELGYTGLNMNFGSCRKQLVERAHALGLKVWVYTVNGKQDMERYLEMGVDAITTRKPEDLLEILSIYKD